MQSQEVVQLWRYPVKSVGGEQLDSARVDSLGIQGDRAAAIYEPATGTTLTARRCPELLFASAQFVGSDQSPTGVILILPDGTETFADDDISAWLDREVQLVGPGDEGGTYEVPLDFENDAEWVSWQGPGGAFHDSTRTRVSLLGLDTCRTWDVGRFRANVVLSGTGEDDLIGRHARVGEVVLDVTKAIDRCVIVTRPQPGLARDLDVLRTINAERASTLGIGCLVASDGMLRIGDPLAVA